MSAALLLHRSPTYHDQVASFLGNCNSAVLIFVEGKYINLLSEGCTYAGVHINDTVNRLGILPIYHLLSRGTLPTDRELCHVSKVVLSYLLIFGYRITSVCIPSRAGG